MAIVIIITKVIIFFIIVSFLMVLLFFPFLTGKGKAKFMTLKGIMPKVKRVIPYTCI